MEYTITIPGRLPGLNELIAAERSNRYKGASCKHKAQKYCETYIKQQLRNIRIKEPVYLTYYWKEKDKRRDLDNISGFGHKVFQDALVNCGTLQNDGWANIVGFTDIFSVDKHNPRIVVTITEVEKIGA